MCFITVWKSSRLSVRDDKRDQRARPSSTLHLVVDCHCWWAWDGMCAHSAFAVTEILLLLFILFIVLLLLLLLGHLTYVKGILSCCFFIIFYQTQTTQWPSIKCVSELDHRSNLWPKICNSCSAMYFGGASRQDLCLFLVKMAFIMQNFAIYCASGCG